MDQNYTVDEINGFITLAAVIVLICCFLFYLLGRVPFRQRFWQSILCVTGIGMCIAAVIKWLPGPEILIVITCATVGLGARLALRFGRWSINPTTNVCALAADKLAIVSKLPWIQRIIALARYARERTLICITMLTLLGVIASLGYPTWVVQYGRADLRLGHAWYFSPPRPYSSYAHIDIADLTVQCLIITGAGGLALLLVRLLQKSTRNDKPLA
jgi:hypothetical protein